GACAAEVVAWRAADGALEGAVALGVAAEVRGEGGRGQCRALVDQVDKAHEPEARAEFHEGEAQIAVELAAHLRWSSAQAPGQLGGAEVGRGSQLADGATAAHVSRARTRAQGSEQLGKLSLDRAMIAHFPEGQRPF